LLTQHACPQGVASLEEPPISVNEALKNPVGITIVLGKHLYYTQSKVKKQ